MRSWSAVFMFSFGLHSHAERGNEVLLGGEVGWELTSPQPP